jgi:DNA polymerase-3 subunit delta'
MIYPWNRTVWQALGPLDTLPPVLLLSGPAGVGKGAFALDLSQALLCSQRGATQEACGDCVSCRLFASGNHPDYRLLQPAAEGEDGEGAEEGKAKTKSQAGARWIKIEAVRELDDFLSLSAHFGRAKVVAIPTADRLYRNAANALLKTLEEPPPETRFILAASRPGQLPATLRSRCMRIPFGLPDTRTSAAWLRTQGVQEPELALAQAGFAPLGAAALDAANYWPARRMLIESALAAPGFDPVAVVEQFGPERLPMLVGALQRWCYDVLLLKATGAIRYHPDCAQILHRVAVRANLLPLFDFLRDLQEVAKSLEHPLNPRLVAEQCLIHYQRAAGISEP